MLFEWDDSLLTGISKIDEDHQKMFAIINEYFDSLMKAEAKKVSMGYMDKFLDYANHHFSLEEKYFDELKYPGALAHKEEHREVMEKVKMYKQYLETGIDWIGSEPTSVEFWKFLKKYLKTHIQTTDKKFTTFYKSRTDF